MVLIWKRVKKFKLDSRRRNLSFSSFHSNRQWSVGTSFMQAYQTFSVHCSILMFSQPPLPPCGKEEKTLENTYKCVPYLFRLFQFSFLDSNSTFFLVPVLCTSSMEQASSVQYVIMVWIIAFLLIMRFG